jgi:hypothetical protein
MEDEETQETEEHSNTYKSVSRGGMEAPPHIRRITQLDMDLNRLPSGGMHLVTRGGGTLNPSG